MKPENFVYWLQGFLELSHQTSLDEIQTKMIRDHLNIVFEKKTPTTDAIAKLSKILRSNNAHGDISVCSNVDLPHIHIPVTC